MQVYPQPAAKSLTVKGRIGNATGRPGGGNVTISIRPKQDAPAQQAWPPITAAVAWTAEGGDFELQTALPESCQRWDEFQPALYQLAASLGDSATSRSLTFGVREITTDGTQFRINGRKTFLRGTLECCIFPATGHPPTEIAEWKRIIGVAKDHGLNLIRFHSWCPPEAAFAAADELGFYFHVECASWANQSATLGDGKPLDRWVYDEADRILKQYGNHPSFVLMAYGNEPGGKRHAAYLAKWVEHFKAADARRLYTSAAGWPELSGEPVSRRARPAHSGLGRRLEVAHQRRAARDRRRLSRFYRKAHGAGHQPRDRPMVRLSQLRRNPEIHRLLEAEELRDLPRHARSARHGRAGPPIPAGFGQAANAVLQGRH